MEITTQLNPRVSQKLSYIQEKTHQDLADIIQQSVELYFERLQEKENPNAGLLNGDFIGCAEGEANSSKNYKELLNQDWASQDDPR